METLACIGIKLMKKGTQSEVKNNNNSMTVQFPWASLGNVKQ